MGERCGQKGQMLASFLAAGGTQGHLPIGFKQLPDLPFHLFPVSLGGKTEPVAQVRSAPLGSGDNWSLGNEEMGVLIKKKENNSTA